MERRREIRYRLNQTAKIVLLDGSGQSLPGHIVNISGKGMRVEVPRRVAPGVPVRVEWDDLLALGEIAYCEEGENSHWVCGFALEEALTNLDELARLWATLSEEQPIEASVDPQS